MILAGTSPRQVSQRLVVWPRNRYGATLRVWRSAAALVGEVAKVVGDAIDHQPRTQEMEDVKRAGQGWIGLEELPREALGAIPDAQGIEAAPHRPRGAIGQSD